MQRAFTNWADPVTGFCVAGVLAVISAACPDTAAAAAESGQAATIGGAERGETHERAAPWVASRQPVPPHVLYTPENPAPAYPPHQESWHRGLLVSHPTCAHCGRPADNRSASYFFLLVGFVGQGLFALRFFVQWLASERAKAVVVPESFWWISIAAVIVTFFYAASLLAWPILLGQALALFIYGRNLYFFRR